MCFKTYRNHPINQKTSQKKNYHRRSQFSKNRGGGVQRGMIMITDSVVVFLSLPLRSAEPSLYCTILYPPSNALHCTIQGCTIFHLMVQYCNTEYFLTTVHCTLHCTALLRPPLHISRSTLFSRPSVVRSAQQTASSFIH